MAARASTGDSFQEEYRGFAGGVDAFGGVCRGVEVTKDPNQAFDAFLGSLWRRWLSGAVGLDDNREDHAVFW
jgi:hypothetical protein